MKKRSGLFAMLLCSAIASYAQDTYWALDGNKIFNTSTKAVATSALASPDFDYNADRSVIFNASAEALFTGGTTSNFTVNDLGQVLPIPTECKKYVSMEIVPQPTPHGHYLRVREIDATAVTNNSMTTGFPTSGSYTYLHGAADAVYWGAVAAKLNTNGTRYIYHLNRPASSWTSTLNRYELNSAGVVNTTPTTLSTTLPPGGFLKMSPDGQAIGYINDNGNFVTYNIATNTATTYSTYSVGLFITPQEIPAIECAIVSGNRRWFLGNNTEVGFVTEGSSGSYTKISGTSLKGTKSSLALGRDGNIYYAFNSSGVSAGAGDLYYFTPSSATGGWSDWLNSNSTAISNAKIATTHGSGSGLCYLFGNQVAGEDVNSATAPTIPPSFTLSGQTGGNIVICDGAVSQLILEAMQFGVSSGYTITVEEGELVSNTFVLTGDTYNQDFAVVDYNPTHDLFTLFGALQNYNGYIRVTFSTISPCGQVLSTSLVFNLILASAAVDFYMIGPSDINSSPVCNYLGVSLVGLQNRVDNSAQVMTNRPSVQTAPPCAEGWLGASSVGLSKGVLTLNNTTVANVPNPYHVVVEEYDASMAFIKTVVNKNLSTIPASSYPFFNKTSPLFYFTNNYNTIRDNYFYKVILSVETDCGIYSKEAYFKILDGGDDGIAFKPGRTTGINETGTITQLEVFPNPATNIVNLSWRGMDAGGAHISLINTMGQVVINQSLRETEGLNNETINISSLPSGVYQYILTTSGGEHKGKIVKQ